jgi:hypothetical protein
MTTRFAPAAQQCAGAGPSDSRYFISEIAQAACDKPERQIALRILPLSRFPVLSKLRGNRQAQESKCAEEGNRFLFNPISASNPRQRQSKATR